MEKEGKADRIRIAYPLQTLNTQKMKRSRFQFKDLLVCPSHSLKGAGKLSGNY
jgi:hypothetical protein